MIRILLIILSLATLLSSGVTALANFGPPFELFSHFRPSFLISTLVVVVVTALKDWRFSVPALMATIFFGFQLLGADWRSEEAGIKGAELKVVWANVFGSREAIERLAMYTEEMNPDIVAIGEPTIISNERLGLLYPKHPYVLKVDNDLHPVHPVILLLSSVPIETSQIRDHADPRRPWVNISVTIDGQLWRLGAAHAMAPFSKRMMLDRNALIRDVEHWMHGPGDVTLGDFNATPWSPVMKNSSLERAGNPFFAPTWGRRIPFLGLPIDHVFVSKHVSVRKHSVGGDIGSDHFPIYVELVRPDTR